MDVKKYLSNPNICPDCGSHELFADGVSARHHEFRQRVRCSVCDEEWVDVYTLTDAEVVEDDEEVE